MIQQCAFVDPSSLSLPSSSLKRPASPACSTDDSTPCPTDEPPRKRSRSTVTPEERKEARAHRNRIAAQNSRDRRKAQFGYLERRVAELEEENRRLRAGIHVSPSPSISAVSEPDHATTLEREREQLRKREEELRERENQELRERIRTLEKGYEAVVRALAAQGTPSITSSIPTPPATSPTPTVPSHSQSSSLPASNSHTSNTSSPSTPNAASSSSAPSLPLSPTSSNSTLVGSPLLFAGCDSFDLPQSPALSSNDVSLVLPSESLDLSVATSTPTRHLARVVNTVGHPAVSLQRVGCAQVVMGLASTPRCWAMMRPSLQPQDEAASDAAITRLFAEILASPPLDSSTLPSTSTSSEDAVSEEVLTKTETNSSDNGLGLGMGGINTVDWVEQVRAEMEMEKLLEMLPSAQDVAVDAISHPNVNFDADMDFSSALTWDGVSVF